MDKIVDMQDAINVIDLVIEQLQVLRTSLSEERGEFPESRRHLVAERVCLNCDRQFTEKSRVIRGVHEYCAKKINDEISAALTTDAIAVSQGRWLPKQSGGRPALVDSSRWLNRPPHEPTPAEVKGSAFRSVDPDNAASRIAAGDQALTGDEDKKPPKKRNRKK